MSNAPLVVGGMVAEPCTYRLWRLTRFEGTNGRHYWVREVSAAELPLVNASDPSLTGWRHVADEHVPDAVKLELTLQAAR